MSPSHRSFLYWRSIASAVVATLLLAGCGGKETPEERVRDYIEQVIDSAEARKWRAFEDYVADAYRDDRGFGKQEVLRIITGYILAHQRIHILERLAAIQIQDPHTATAVVYAAIAGQPLSGPRDLTRIAADLYRFEIQLHTDTDGELRAAWGDWQAVGPQEFLTGR